MYPWQSFILGLCEHLAWPLFASICIIYFNKDIRNILSRIKTLPGGTKLNPEQTERIRETTKEQEKDKKEFDELYQYILNSKTKTQASKKKAKEKK